MLIRATDTDILIIMLGNTHRVNATNINILMIIGVGIKSQIISITDMHQGFSPNVVKALPGLHAFTGSDYTLSFRRKRKKYPLNNLIESTEFQEAFIRLGDIENLDEQVLKLLEEFVCRLYKKNVDNVDVARFNAFINCYNPKDNLFKEKIKTCDSTLLPPCQKE